MNKEYNAPELEVVVFTTEEVMTASDNLQEYPWA